MEFGLIAMFTSMGTVAKTVAILLICLSVITIYLFIERLIVFSSAKNKSKQVAPKIADLLKSGKMQEALNLCSKKEYRGSHLARVSAAGIKEFLEGKEVNLDLEEQISTAQRGCDRDI